jgi:hypothetical protein
MVHSTPDPFIICNTVPFGGKIQPTLHLISPQNILYVLGDFQPFCIAPSSETDTYALDISRYGHVAEITDVDRDYMN